MSSHKAGRHRAPNPLTSGSFFSSALSRSFKPASQATAVIAISGAMVASLAAPVSAATVTDKTVALPATVPAALAAAAPSAAQAPLAPRTFGTIGFTGVIKPKPKPKPVPVVVPVSVPEPAPAPEPAAEPVVRERTPAPVSRAAARAPIARPEPAPEQASTQTPTQAPTQEAPTQKAPAPKPAANSGGVLDIAASLAGIYYIYGGTTTAGFDCSGFTQYVYNKVGINLPRTAEEQRQATTPVTDPRPGDLVFFGAPAYHNGIYAGGGKIWDSPKTGSKISLRPLWTTSGVTYGRP